MNRFHDVSSIPASRLRGCDAIRTLHSPCDENEWWCEVRIANSIQSFLFDAAIFENPIAEQWRWLAGDCACVEYKQEAFLCRFDLSGNT